MIEKDCGFLRCRWKNCENDLSELPHRQITSLFFDQHSLTTLINSTTTPFGIKHYLFVFKHPPSKTSPIQIPNNLYQSCRLQKILKNNLPTRASFKHRLLLVEVSRCTNKKNWVPVVVDVAATTVGTFHSPLFGELVCVHVLLMGACRW